MKNVLKQKSSETDSPKTPGGISRSLLTPCRRVGLSKNFKKSGASPFQSPLSANTEVKQPNKETRKRKDSFEETSETPENDDNSALVQTPTRNVELPRRKKSKTQLISMSKNSEDLGSQSPTKIDPLVSNDISNTSFQEKYHLAHNVTNEKVSSPIHTKSLHVKTPIKVKTSPKKAVQKENSSDNIKHSTSIHIQSDKIEKTRKTKSPNNLSKECVVVLQKKIFKKEINIEPNVAKLKSDCNYTEAKTKDTISQAVFDSDSDDVPLSSLHNKEKLSSMTQKNINEDEDFQITKSKVHILDNSKPSKSNTKSPASNKNKNSSNLKVTTEMHKPPNSQNLTDDDDFFETKKTILIRKSYDKVVKPQKAKSTGSITQNDIDNLKARIEVKKKMLLARASTEDSKELRDLIKKWQKGCQDALMELMDLMKNKFPDKQNMDYSEILQTLKIPASLVGYDSDNDSFLTPDDESIILANVK